MVWRRVEFFMGLKITKEKWEGMITKAVRQKVDVFTSEYALACKRLSEWRINWFTDIGSWKGDVILLSLKIYTKIVLP
jgi:hypothetical protein